MSRAVPNTPGHHPMGCQHKLYMLTCKEFDELRAAARGICARCKRDDRPLVVDHDHAVGDWAVRGMICHQCNAYMALVDRGDKPVDGLTADYLASAYYKSRPPKIRKFPRSRCPECGGNILWSRKTRLFHLHDTSGGERCPQSRRPVPASILEAERLTTPA